MVVKVGERMKQKKSSPGRLLLPLLFWAGVALVILVLPPVPHEPEGLPPETWSYYGSQAPLGSHVLQYRNELLCIVLICAIISELLFFILEKRTEHVIQK